MNRSEAFRELGVTEIGRTEWSKYAYDGVLVVSIWEETRLGDLGYANVSEEIFDNAVKGQTVRAVMQEGVFDDDLNHMKTLSARPDRYHWNVIAKDVDKASRGNVDVLHVLTLERKKAFQ